MTPGRFIRLTLRDFYYCDHANGGALVDTAFATGVSACDFPTNRVEKSTRTSAQ